ncbi:Proline-rich receptor-like protein kinase PERK4 [Hibiscus syriacus]|uniref:non-specific serine/threonine protein kinase n=1 Tax=Hibiscus syriacus TaxID=106335 RepID=A0A6A2X7R0_HIBSY|nr:Proline-rich receptor-like protein kinase PERK4 [Hibiscus syriacus]
MARLSAIVYCDREIREDEIGVVFVSNERVKISFKRNITLEELITKISRNVHVGSSRRMSSLQYIFPASLLPLTYTAFELSNNDDVEMMVDSQSNYSDADIDMYAKFVQVCAVRGQSLSSHYGLAEQVDQVDSPTTVMCNDFNAIMGNLHHGVVTSTSMGRHLSATPYDMYRGGSMNNPYDNIAPNSRGRHSSANFFDLNMEMPSTQQSGRRASSRFFDLNVESMEEPSSPPEEPLREPGADGAETGIFIHPETPQFNYDDDVDSLKCMEFSSKEEVMMATKNYNIRNSVQSRVDRSTTEKYVCYCARRENGCNWMVCISKRKRKSNRWELTIYNDPHICCAGGVNQDHPNLDSEVICQAIMPMVKANSHIVVVVLISAIQSQYEYTVSYKKAWLAKQKAIVKLHGEWDASYNELPGRFRLVRRLNLGIIVDFETFYAYHNDRVLRDRCQFYRVFWTYPQCVNVVKYCKHVVQIDETFLERALPTWCQINVKRVTGDMSYCKGLLLSPSLSPSPLDSPSIISPPLSGAAPTSTTTTSLCFSSFTRTAFGSDINAATNFTSCSPPHAAVVATPVTPPLLPTPPVVVVVDSPPPTRPAATTVSPIVASPALPPPPPALVIPPPLLPIDPPPFASTSPSPPPTASHSIRALKTPGSSQAFPLTAPPLTPVASHSISAPNTQGFFQAFPPPAPPPPLTLTAAKGVCICCKGRARRRKQNPLDTKKQQCSVTKASIQHKEEKVAPPPLTIAIGSGSNTAYTNGSSGFFTYEELVIATDGFSESNLLGQGGFGYVYKARLLTRQDVAVKKLKAGSCPTIIHRDIKAANILLDPRFEAKIFFDASLSVTHISTRVMGTFGYLAPEYALTGKVTDKSDVYSYGVMLLELITERHPSIELESSARPLLARALEDNDFDTLVDPRLNGSYNNSEMATMVSCATDCIRQSAWLRPRMIQVVRALEDGISLTMFSNNSLNTSSEMFIQNARRCINNGGFSGHSEPTGEYGLNLNPSGSSTESQRTKSRDKF